MCTQTAMNLSVKHDAFALIAHYLVMLSDCTSILRDKKLCIPVNCMYKDEIIIKEVRNLYALL